MDRNDLIKYVCTVVVLIAIDAPYLYATKNMYQQKIQRISGKPLTKRYYSGLVVYLAIALVMVIFALPRIRKDNIVLDSITYGGILGLTTYAVFDFTTHFMFEGWDIGISVFDSLWGGVLCSLATMIITKFV
jgi:uncharacterized membrane protein